MEFAVVLPLLLLFAFAAVDFGRVVHAHTVVANAARAGAEYGSMHKFTPFTQSSWEAQVRQAVQDEMEGMPHYDSGTLVTEIATSNDGDGLFQVTVTVSYAFQTIANIPGVPSQTDLSHAVTMRQIR